MKRNNISYSFYFNTYNNGNKGLIPESSFDLYIAKAWRELEPLLTSEYDDEHVEKVSFTVCEIAEELYQSEKIRGIKSENIDGYSVTYADGDSARKNIINIAVRNLGNTGLLYLGVEK